MRLRTKVALAATAFVATLGVAAPAMAWPVSISVAQTSNQTGAAFWSGSGSIRAWQYCETPSGQTNWYSYGSWRGINSWSWTGTCTIIRDRGFDVRNY